MLRFFQHHSGRDVESLSLQPVLDDFHPHPVHNSGKNRHGRCKKYFSGTELCWKEPAMLSDLWYNPCRAGFGQTSILCQPLPSMNTIDENSYKCRKYCQWILYIFLQDKQRLLLDNIIVITSKRKHPMKCKISIHHSFINFKVANSTFPLIKHLSWTSVLFVFQMYK